MVAHGSIISMEVSGDHIRVRDTITISAIIENTGSYGAFHIAQFLGWEKDLGPVYFPSEIEQTAVAGKKGARWSFENTFNIHDRLLQYGQKEGYKVKAYTVTTQDEITYPEHGHEGLIMLLYQKMHDIKTIDLVIDERPIEEPEPRISPWVIIVLIAIVLIILLWEG